jgi:hypothetical protein
MKAVGIMTAIALFTGVGFAVFDYISKREESDSQEEGIHSSSSCASFIR